MNHVAGFAMYPIFSPPMDYADRPPWEWKPFEARGYFDWFLENIETRIAALGEAIVETGSSDWLDGTPASLTRLGDWLERSIVVAKKGAEQKSQEIEALPPVLRKIGESVVEDWDLTPESLSIAVDVGIYLGEVFRRNLSEVEWVLCNRPKSNVSFHQPVLRGFGKRTLDPIRGTVGIAFGMARGDQNVAELERGFRMWSEQVSR
jgi:hypothetical protein